MQTHELKIWPEYFDAIERGDKTFEARRNDRDFQVGDTLILKEWEMKGHFYTGRELRRTVSYMLGGGDDNFGVCPGFCVMALRSDTGDANNG